jgi:hypothetical protein
VGRSERLSGGTATAWLPPQYRMIATPPLMCRKVARRPACSTGWSADSVASGSKVTGASMSTPVDVALLYSPHKEIANQARDERTSVGDQLSACWSHPVQEGRCDRGFCRHSRGPVAWSSALQTVEAAAEEAAAAEAAEAEAAAAAKEEAEEAEAADGASVRKPERHSVPAAARPSLPAQPLGPVVALRVGESTGSAPSGPVARERRFGWDPEQARRRAGVPALRTGEGSTRRRRQRPPRGTPRSRAPSASCLPLSRLLRHRVTSPSAAARGLGTFDPISACQALQSLVRVVCPGLETPFSGNTNLD